MSNLSSGAIEAIVSGQSFDNPILQVLSSRKMSGTGSDRFRLLLSDGDFTYSHAMLATQLNHMIEDGTMDNLAVIKIEKYMCNKIQGDRRILIVLEAEVLSKGEDIGGRIGNPQAFKPSGGQEGGSDAPMNGHESNPPPSSAANNTDVNSNLTNKAPVNKPAPAASHTKGLAASPMTSKPSYTVKGASTPGSGSARVNTIDSLTPYQNRWRIRARVTQKSTIRTWNNSRGEGKLFSVNLLDESGEIRGTGFNEAVDKYYDMLEVNKVYFFSRATLKTANKQYTNIKNDYEMTFNQDTQIEFCDEDVSNLPTVTFEFKKIKELEACKPDAIIDVIGIVQTVGDTAKLTSKKDNREFSKREVHIVDQSNMGVNLTLWGAEADSFQGKSGAIIAVKGVKVSDFGGRSVSCMGSSQLVMDPDIREAHFLRGWYDKEGCQSDFSTYQSTGGGGSAPSKTFAQAKCENLGQGEKGDYFANKATVIFLKKDNSMYQACPTDACNKKVVDQGNGMFRCEKCNREFPNFKWRMILSANLADFSDNNWVTCFQESAELLLCRTADEIGNLKQQNEAEYDQVFQEALFKSYMFKLRTKMETYNDEPRQKTVCIAVKPVDWREYGQQLIQDINNLAN